ncbi:MAG TPA: OmpA family protein [Saprospiraceae bacterium]|nr:OmpA family protein [Saprospiraceae bacterium]HRX29873.1 OmpA family protein [Saprospiraceae bacterium]
MVNSIALLGLILTFSSCLFKPSVKDAQSAIDAKQYYIATEYLEKDYRGTSNSAKKSKLALGLGDTFMKLHEYQDAKKWYKNSLSQDENANAIIGLIESSEILGQYDEAMAYLSQLEKINPNSRYVKNKSRYLRETKRLSQQVDKNINLELVRFNSRSNDYSPAIFDENFIVFSSDRDESTGDNAYNWTGYDYSDIFVVTKNSTRRAKIFDAFINTESNEGGICFNKDYSMAIFSRCTQENPTIEGTCELYSTDNLKGYWSEPELLPFVQKGVNYGQPTLFDNDQLLIFSSTQEGGAGGHDLFYSQKLEDGTWSEIYALPKTINTEGDEMFPTADADTLYFSSTGLPGLGGLDIFRIYLNRETDQWSLPEHLSQPINSSFDDFGLIIDRQESRHNRLNGYFTSNRPGLGGDDIYSFQKSKGSLIDKEVADEKLSEIDSTIHLYLLISCFENTFNDPDNPNSGVLRKEKLPEVKLNINLQDNTVNKMVSDANGQAFSEIKLGKNYKLNASKPGYLSKAMDIDTRNLSLSDSVTSHTVNVSITLNKIYYDKEIVLENIYYDFNKWNIREDAKPILDELADMLLINKNISIELSSHTDCRGDEEYNIELSQKRAESAVEYLISKNIDPIRLIAKGYGESQALDNCLCDECNEAQHQKNRRTSFRIIKL